MVSHGSTFQRGEKIAAMRPAKRRLEAMALGMQVMEAEPPVGRFGRLFEGLPTFEASNETLAKVAERMRERADDPAGDSDIPLGFAFLGQFIDHDITFDPVSRLDERLDPNALRNFRTPGLDLDNVYGEGPDGSRHLYDTMGANEASEHRLPFRLLEGDAAHPRDLPRNSAGTAIIGDPRNDENLLISQIHAAFLRFHNAVVRRLLLEDDDNPRDNKKLFESARRIVTAHYHHVVVDEFLPFIIGRDLVEDIKVNGPKFFHYGARPFIPVEFGGAAYRMGHTLIRAAYALNEHHPKEKPIALFDLPFFGLEKTNLDDRDAKHKRVQGGYHRQFEVDFSYFAPSDKQENLQFCRRIDARVAAPLFALPFIHQGQDAPASLPERNMRRGRTLGLPSGQEVAKRMGIEPIDNAALGIADIEGLRGQAPLWFYVLGEAGLNRDKGRLGPVGGRIVGEVLLGLVQAVQKDYSPNFTWSDLKPTLNGEGKKFGLADLLTFADRPDPKD